MEHGEEGAGRRSENSQDCVQGEILAVVVTDAEPRAARGRCSPPVVSKGGPVVAGVRYQVTRDRCGMKDANWMREGGRGRGREMRDES